MLCKSASETVEPLTCTLLATSNLVPGFLRASTFNSVVLPLPEGPIRAVSVPNPIQRECGLRIQRTSYRPRHIRLSLKEWEWVEHRSNRFFRPRYRAMRGSEWWCWSSELRYWRCFRHLRKSYLCASSLRSNRQSPGYDCVEKDEIDEIRIQTLRR